MLRRRGGRLAASARAARAGLPPCATDEHPLLQASCYIKVESTSSSTTMPVCDSCGYTHASTRHVCALAFTFIFTGSPQKLNYCPTHMYMYDRQWRGCRTSQCSRSSIPCVPGVVTIHDQPTGMFGHVSVTGFEPQSACRHAEVQHVLFPRI